MALSRIQVHLPAAAETLYCRSGIAAHELLAHYPGPPEAVLAVRINHEVKHLNTPLTADAKVEFLDVATMDGNKIYQRTLSMVLVAAMKELYPCGEVGVEHSLSGGLYCTLSLGRTVQEEDVRALEQRMREIVAQRRPIFKKILPRQEAIILFAAENQPTKVRLLESLEREIVSLYYCGDTHNYFYGVMAPNTAQVPLFALQPYHEGFVMLFPSRERPGEVPVFVDHPKLAQVFQEAEAWGNILECDNVGSLNGHLASGQTAPLVRIAEALHEKKIAQIADFIAEHRQQVRLILIAGPSSSGKTTFAQRLNIQLRVNGVKPLSISLDDYFVNREYTPIDEEGKPDFESIDAIDLKLFNHHLGCLLAGEEVETPSFNFHTGRREVNGKRLRIAANQPLIVEGIHGLNERLTQAVPRQNKIKVYISALTQLSLDQHNRIPTTDARLLRRIARDHQFRSHDALATLRIWPSVRRGEERNIFPYQEEADVMFNSALIYELAMLRKHVQPLLEAIGPGYSEYSEAKRLLSFLAYFHDVEDTLVPANSILREFIGGSCFHEA